MAPTWDERGPLILDVDGILWERYRGGYAWHGPIADADLRENLEAFAAELLDLWTDAFDPRAEAEASWRLSCE